MEFLAKKIIAHFNVKGGKTSISIKNDIESFLRKHKGFTKATGGGHYIDTKLLKLTYRYCELLKIHGLLMDFENQRKVPILGNKYINFDFDKGLGEYGGYDFLIEGFQSIQKAFKKSVLKVVVQYENFDHGIGTCFVIGEDLIMTAKHCIHNFKKISIYDDDENLIIPKEIIVPEDENIDLAMIKTVGKPFVNTKQFMLGEPEVLEEVLTVGYPPLATFDAIQINETAHINSIQKSSKGNIVAKELKYRETTDYLILNTRVKGGNSGGPVINKFGTVLGVIVQLLPDIKEPLKLDELGYGVAISSSEIINLVESAHNGNGCKNIDFVLIESGFSTL